MYRRSEFDFFQEMFFAVTFQPTPNISMGKTAWRGLARVVFLVINWTGVQDINMPLVSLNVSRGSSHFWCILNQIDASLLGVIS